MDAVTRELEAKGLVPDSEAPDLQIAIHTERRDQFSIIDWGYHYAPYDAYHRGDRYWYGSGIDVLEYEEGSLILDVVRADEDELIWRGVYSEALPLNMTSDKITKLVDQAVARILANFPVVKADQDRSTREKA
jgi:hypothetical protein